MEIKAGIESGEMKISAHEATALPQFVATVIADTSRKLSTRAVQLKDITPIILLILRASGVNAQLAKEAASQKISRALPGSILAC